MNNEPVAWMIKTLDGRSLMLYGEEQPPKFKEDVQYIPLYTHPAKELKNIVLACVTCSCGKVMEVTNLQPVKELTDEEIRHIQAICHLKDVGYDGFIMRFARAILLKAQEK